MQAVLDSSAILEGFVPVPPADFAVPPLVVEEVSRGRAGRRMQGLVAAGLIVREPDEEARQRVQDEASRMGEGGRLSQTDMDVLALALELGLPCLTDDYSVQNVAARLGVPVRPFKERGIREVWEWGLRCPGCGRWAEEGEEEGGECPVCATPMRPARRPPSPRA
jgi:UPF0271 protein